MKNTNLTGTVVFDTSEPFIPPKRTSAPAGVEGAIYFDTTLKKLRIFENGSWVNLNTGSGNETLEYTITGLTTTEPIQFNSALSITKTQRTQHIFYEISNTNGDVRTGYIMMSFSNSGVISMSDEDTFTSDVFLGFRFFADVDDVDTNLCNLYYEISEDIDASLNVKFILTRF